MDDDGLFGSNKDDIVRAVHILLEDGPPDRGLHLSTETNVPVHGNSKSRLWSPCQKVRDTRDPLDLGILAIKEEGFIHLGDPIGPEYFVHKFLTQQIEKTPYPAAASC